MCGEEPFGVHEMGSPEDGEGLDARSLYAYYRDYFLRRLKVKIFVCSMETAGYFGGVDKTNRAFYRGAGGRPAARLCPFEDAGCKKCDGAL